MDRFQTTESLVSINMARTITGYTYANFEQLQDLNLQPKIIRRLSELNDAFDIIYLSAGFHKSCFYIKTYSSF